MWLCVFMCYLREIKRKVMVANVKYYLNINESDKNLFKSLVEKFGRTAKSRSSKTCAVWIRQKRRMKICCLKRMI